MYTTYFDQSHLLPPSLTQYIVILFTHPPIALCYLYSYLYFQLVPQWLSTEENDTHSQQPLSINNFLGRSETWWGTSSIHDGMLKDPVFCRYPFLVCVQDSSIPEWPCYLDSSVSWPSSPSSVSYSLFVPFSTMFYVPDSGEGGWYRCSI